MYYENGQVNHEGQYKEGKETGTWTRRDEQGKIIRETNYDKTGN